MPGHNTAKKRKSSYTKEADNHRNCPLNLRINKNLSPLRKRKPQRERRLPRVRKPSKTVEQPSSPTVEENSRKEKKGPAHLVKSTAKAKAETKKIISARIQTSPVPAPPKETQTPRRGKKESETQTPAIKTPATMNEVDYSVSGHHLVLMMQTFATALAAQLNITLQTEQVKKATRATFNATKFLTRTSENKMGRQKKCQSVWMRA